MRDRIFANWPWPLSGAVWVEKPIPQPPPTDDTLREHLRREREEGRLLTKEQLTRMRRHGRGVKRRSTSTSTRSQPGVAACPA